LLQFVMAGLVPAIPIVGARHAAYEMPATQASEATPFFERLCAGITN